jgi:hypothetical protein
MAVCHVAGLSDLRKRTQHLHESGLRAGGLALILGRVRLRAPAANGDRQLIIFADTLT